MKRNLILTGLILSFLAISSFSWAESETPKKTFSEQITANKKNLDILVAKVRETFEKIKTKLIEFRDQQKESRESMQNLNQKSAAASEKAEKAKNDTKTQMERAQTRLREQAEYQKKLQQDARAEQQRMRQMQQDFNRQYKH